MKLLMITLMAGASALFAQQATPPAPSTAPAPPPKRFLKLDKDGDGRISLDEFKAVGDPVRRERRFRRLDTNHDGFLSPEEFAAGMKPAK
jgi:hypothetical protein